MIPVGYMAKRIESRPEWLNAPQVLDVYSVGACVSENFAEYVDYWKHNVWWFFNSPEVIQELSRENSIDLQDTSLFYYEVHELEFDNGNWRGFSPWEDPSKDSNSIIAPSQKRLTGYDVVTFWPENSPAPEHSPLSCNGLATTIQTNAHCLLNTFEEAQAALNAGQFTRCDPGALRIFAVYSVDWPSD
jgi:hypothetical protein